MADEFAPADWQTRSLAFLIDLILYIALFYGLGGVSHFVATFLSMISSSSGTASSRARASGKR